MQREAIYQALFDKASGAAGFVTKSRKLRHIDDVPSADMPAIFMLQLDEDPLTKTGQPTRWLLRAELFIYANAGGDPEASPMSALNPLLDAVTNLFNPDPAFGRQTLGGLVEYARVSGTVKTGDNINPDQSLAIVPIEMLVAAF